MTERTVDEKLKVYSEVCGTLRHYSNASLTVRVVSIVQGIGLLIAWAYVLSKAGPKYSLAIPIAGFLFTALLYRFHMGYFRAIGFFYEQADKMERDLFEEPYRPFGTYENYHKNKYENFLGRFFTLNVPFTLIGFLFVIALVVNAWFYL